MSLKISKIRLLITRLALVGSLLRLSSSLALKVCVRKHSDIKEMLCDSKLRVYMCVLPSNVGLPKLHICN